MVRPTIGCCAAVGVAFLLRIATVAAQDAPAPPAASASQPASDTASPVLCPVTSRPIDRRYALRFRGRMVYCASADAVAELRRDPEVFADQIRAQWEALRPSRVQVRCPVTGRPVEARFFADSPAGEVYFASADARDQWLADESRFAARLGECYSFQTRCLMCDENIDPAISAEIDGRTVFFGCQGCIEPFQKDRSANLKRLDEQIAANRRTFENSRRP